MFRRSFKTLFFLSVVLFFAAATFAEPRIGQLLEEAMAARKTESVSDVSDKFIIAANSASSNNQRSNVLFIFSDYLLDKQEWEKAIQVQHRIIDYGNPSSQAGAYYNLIRANLELNKIDDAKIAAVELNACPEGESMRAHAHSMKKLAPTSVHARISDLLTETAANPYLVGASKIETQPSSSTQTTSAQIAPYSQIETTPSEAQPLHETKSPEQRDSNPFSVIIGGWNSVLKGNLDSQGMSLDFDNDLSSDRETSLTIAAEYSPNKRDKYKATYVNFSFSGTLNKTFIHSGRTYNPGAEFHVRSKFIDLEGFREMRQRSRVTWGVLYGLMLTDSDLEIAQSIPGTRQITTWESRFGYPYLGLAARSNHGGSLGWEASGKFFVWNGDGRYKTHDLELKLLLGQGSRGISSKRKFWGYLGYRDFCWDGDFGEDRIELRFSGPILGIEFFF